MRRSVKTGNRDGERGQASSAVSVLGSDGLEVDMDWPPKDGREFIHSTRFNRAVLKLVEEHGVGSASARVDAVALLFAGLDERLARDRIYLDSFTSWEDLQVYLKGRLIAYVERSEQRRRQRDSIWPLADDDLP
jgi:hypothetical protein